MPTIAFLSAPGSPGAELACQLAVHGLESSGLKAFRSPPGRWGLPYGVSMPESRSGVDADPFAAPTFRALCMDLDFRREPGGPPSPWPEGAFEVVALRSPMPGFDLPGRAAFHVRLQRCAPADPCAGWATHPAVPTLMLPELDEAEQASLETGRPPPRVHALAARIAELVLERIGDGAKRVRGLRWPTSSRRRLPVRGRTGVVRGR